MPTYDYAKGAGTGLPAVRGGQCFVVERLLDFAQIALDRAAAGLTALAAADVLQVIHVPANVHVLECFAECLVVEGETATIGVGDGSNTSGYISAFSCNALGVVGSLITTTYSVATAGGKIYTAADTIDVILNTAVYNVAKIRVAAAMVDLRAVETYGR